MSNEKLLYPCFPFSEEILFYENVIFKAIKWQLTNMMKVLYKVHFVAIFLLDLNLNSA